MISQKYVLFIMLFSAFFISSGASLAEEITKPQESFDKVKKQVMEDRKEVPEEDMFGPATEKDTGPAKDPGFAKTKQTLTIEGSESKGVTSYKMKIEKIIENARENIEEINEELKSQARTEKDLSPPQAKTEKKSITEKKESPETVKSTLDRGPAEDPGFAKI